MLFSLSDSLVKLSSFGVMRAKALLLDNDSGDTLAVVQDNRDDWFVVNADTGLVWRRPDVALFRAIIEPIQFSEAELQELGIPYHLGNGLQRPSPGAVYTRKVRILDLPEMDDMTLRTVLALLGHQVEGD